MERIKIYTDGVCSGNPGPGANGAVLVMGELKKEISCGYRKTTNNRMELNDDLLADEAYEAEVARLGAQGELF